MIAQRKAQLAELGYEVLAELHPRDLVRVENGFSYPAGRLSEDTEMIPEGTEIVRNHHRNKWWARGPQGRVILICEDGA